MSGESFEWDVDVCCSSIEKSYLKSHLICVLNPLESDENSVQVARQNFYESSRAQFDLFTYDDASFHNVRRSCLLKQIDF